MKIGYMRVSTDEQHLDLQRQALEAAECGRIFEDHGVSGSATERKGLKKALRRSKPVMFSWCGSSIAWVDHCRI